jgi:LPXTG-motif cell wall-anchored protein
MNLKLRTIYLISTLLITGGGAAGAVPPPNPVTIEISASKAGISIGDSVSIRCTVTLPENTRAGVPFPKEKNPLIDLEQQQWTGEEKTPAGTVRRYGFLAYVAATDSVRLGPFAVDYVTAGGDSGQAVSNVLALKVTGVDAAPDSTLRPSRAPFEIGSKGIPSWLIPLAAVVLAALAAWFLLKRRKKRPAPAPVVVKPLDEIEEFESIRALHLREKGQVKELYAMVSTALRGFIGRNMGFDAVHSTTDEIRRMLERRWKDRGVTDSMRVILEESDMVKFAKYLPPDQYSDTVIDRAIVPVRSVLDQIAAERERERLAEEERKRAAAPAPKPAEPGIYGGGEGERK